MGSAFSMGRWTLAAAIAGLACTSAGAQDVTFRPRVGAGPMYLDNVLYVGVEPPGTDLSDVVTAVVVVLPVQRVWRSGSWWLEYQPSYQKYSEFDDLDHDEHRLSFALKSTPSRVSTTTLDLGYSNTWTPDNLGDLSTMNYFLNPINERHKAEGKFGYERELSPRWAASFDALAMTYRFDDISGVENIDPDFDQESEDRDEYGASVGFDRAVSRATALGFEYSYRRYEYEVSGNDTVHLLSFTIDHVISRSTTFEVGVGAFDQRSDSGFQGNLLLKRALETSDLILFAKSAPSSAASFGGTTDTFAAGLTWETRRRPRWDWSLTARYAIRESVDPGETELDSAGVGAWLERRWKERVGVRVSGIVQDQSGSTDLENNLSVGIVRAVAIWYPRGSGWNDPDGPP